MLIIYLAKDNLDRKDFFRETTRIGRRSNLYTYSLYGHCQVTHFRFSLGLLLLLAVQCSGVKNIFKPPATSLETNPGVRWRHRRKLSHRRRHSNSKFHRGLVRRPPGPAAALPSRIPQILSAVRRRGASLGWPALLGGCTASHSIQPESSSRWFQSDAESQDG